MRRASSPSNPFFSFLRKLRADGRTNMYGAVPYLMSRFGLNRETAFRIVCDWLDQQMTAEAATPTPRRRKSPARSST